MYMLRVSSQQCICVRSDLVRGNNLNYTYWIQSNALLNCVTKKREVAILRNDNYSDQRYWTMVLSCFKINWTVKHLDSNPQIMRHGVIYKLCAAGCVRKLSNTHLCRELMSTAIHVWHYYCWKWHDMKWKSCFLFFKYRMLYF